MHTYYWTLGYIYIIIPRLKRDRAKRPSRYGTHCTYHCFSFHPSYRLKRLWLPDHPSPCVYTVPGDMWNFPETPRRCSRGSMAAARVHAIESPTTDYCVSLFAWALGKTHTPRIIIIIMTTIITYYYYNTAEYNTGTYSRAHKIQYVSSSLASGFYIPFPFRTIR